MASAARKDFNRRECSASASRRFLTVASRRTERISVIGCIHANTAGRSRHLPKQLRGASHTRFADLLEQAVLFEVALAFFCRQIAAGEQVAAKIAAVANGKGIHELACHGDRKSVV